MNCPRIGIYAGSGTSHSWLWFVDLFEKSGFYNLAFLDEFPLRNNEIKDLDVLVVSGGDTFGVAQSLGEKGGKSIREFVENGGLYIGSCAGAYLPMKSSQKPLDKFNFVDVKITNLSKLFPAAEIQICKSCAAYGYDFIFHPVREAVVLKTTSFFNKNSSVKFTAPLFGGPGMKACDPSWVLAVYNGFTPKTSFFTTREIAEKTLMGNGAIVRVPLKLGCFYLLGPHLEHPKFKQANRFIIDAIVKETGMDQDHNKVKESDHLVEGELTGKEAKKLILSIRRELSNSRIVTGNLEFLPVQWLIGQKVYEPQKIRVYLESMWKRLRVLEKNKILILINTELPNIIADTAGRITIELRRLKQQIDGKKDSLETATAVFDLLHILSISFFDLYFATLSGGMNRKRGLKGIKISNPSDSFCTQSSQVITAL